MVFVYVSDHYDFTWMKIVLETHIMIMKDDGGSLCINDLKNFIYHRYIPILARKIIAEKYCSMKKSAYICIYSENLLIAGSALKTAAILMSSFIGIILP